MTDIYKKIHKIFLTFWKLKFKQDKMYKECIKEISKKLGVSEAYAKKELDKLLDLYFPDIKDP